MKKIGIGLLLAVLIPVYLILLPFLLLTMFIRLPFEKKRHLELEENIEKVWLPHKKYIYVQYSSLEPMKSFVESNILTNKHIVAHEWDDSGFKWSNINWGKVNKRIETTLLSEMTPDCDGLASFYAVGIDPETKKFNRAEEITVFGDTETGIYQINDEDFTEKEIKDKIKKHVHRLLEIYEN